MAANDSASVTCPACSSRQVRTVSRNDNLRPRLQTGNLQADLRPVSTTLTCQCQEPPCGHEWTATSPQ